MERQLEFQDERNNLKEQLNNINNNRHPIALLLDGLTDIRNIGALFRVADAARVAKIYLYQCNFQPNNKKIQRISRSTLQYVPFQILHTLEEVQTLKNNHQLVGLEITSESIPYTQFIPQKEILLIIGNERSGISEKLLELTDNCIHLPMYGINTSMNVTCATSIAVYDILAKQKTPK